MSASTPKRIGPYVITREIGRGGMGIVYLARDTRLERDVAIKALPEHLESDPDRLARFQREARALASMNHPNIGAIHGLEVESDKHYLVLEFVAGESLDARLARGPMDTAEATEIAIQIASALEAAHDQGIVHRDLKPANIMLTPEGTAKVLDFGLARTPDVTGSSTDVTVPPDSPTLTSPMPVHSPTIPGAIMGTAGYMSPEQARGRTVDKRSDVFSFGCVLYEMLTGLRPFSGETVADVLGATLHKELDLSQLPAETPANVRRVLRRCLAKDKRQRLHDIADARLELSEPETVEHAAAPTSPRRDRIVQVLVPILIVVAAWAWINRPTAPTTVQLPAELPVVRFEQEVEGEVEPILISPDGTMVAYTLDFERTWLRLLDQPEPRELDIPTGAAILGWSEDSTSIYYAEGLVGLREAKSLWKFDVERGTRRFVAEMPDTGFLWTMGPCITEVGGDRLVLSMSAAGLFEFSLDGGTARQIVEPVGDEVLISPSAIPGTDAVLFSNVTEGRLELFEDGERTTILERPGTKLGMACYAEPGIVFFEVFGADQLTGIWAVRFSVDEKKAVGSPIRVFGEGVVSPSRTGQLVFMAANRRPAHARELVWFDPATTALSPAFDQTLFDMRHPALNADGERVVVSARPSSQSEVPLDLFVLNLRTGARSQLTDDLGSDIFPAWRSDGETVVFNTWGAGVRSVRERGADGREAARTIDSRVGRFVLSPDDEFMLVAIDTLDYYRSGSDERVVFIDDSDWDFDLHPSKDYVAYKPLGTPGIVIRPFPSGEGRTQVVDQPAQRLHFAPDGKSLYYWAGEALMSVSIDLSGPQPIVGSPRVVLQASDHRLFPGAAFDIGRDGRLLMIRATDEELNETNESVLTVIQNWPEALDLKPDADGR